MNRSEARGSSYPVFLRPGPWWGWLSIVLYVIACFLPAMPPFFGTEPIYGWECLTLPLMAFPPWWANPTYFLALLFYWRGRGRVATVLSVIAAVLACSFELLEVPNKGWVLPQQEVGCYVWITSLQILACNLLWSEWLRWRERENQFDVGVNDSSPSDDTASTI